jgi:LemA protein
MPLGNAGYMIGALIVAAALYVAFYYNRLVRARNMLQEGWSGIDVQLRRRADLVPNLVETVKGYAAHEHGIFEDLADKRAQSLAANSVTGQIAAEQAMQGALGRLFAVAEAYPALKADANFRQLQTELEQIEEELQLARRYYNGVAREMNTRVQSFPGNLVAAGFGFTTASYFELGDEAARAVPKVAFG